MEKRIRKLKKQKWVYSNHVSKWSTPNPRSHWDWHEQFFTGNHIWKKQRLKRGNIAVKLWEGLCGNGETKVKWVGNHTQWMHPMKPLPRYIMKRLRTCLWDLDSELETVTKNNIKKWTNESNIM